MDGREKKPGKMELFTNQKGRRIQKLCRNDSQKTIYAVKEKREAKTSGGIEKL